MVSAAITLLFILFISKPSVKIALVLGLPTLAMLAIPFVPSHAMDRLTTFFRSGDNQTSEATESAEARRRLFEQSITLTLSHPVLGVGPGQFMESEGALAKASGQRGMWHQTHNTYTQVSSECGIPALICFVSALIFTLRRLWKARSADDPLLASVAQVLFISTFAFAVCVFFLSHAYGFAFLISTSLAISIDRLRAMRESAPADVPTEAGRASVPFRRPAASRQLPQGA
jgi:O-antigen ligase